MTNNKHRSGFVSIIGRPNVGKSTLINSLMKEKLSIITSKAQTTRHRIRGIINGDDYQIVLSDTPGILDPSYKLQEAMMKFIKETLIDSDFLVIVEEVGNKESFDESLVKKLNSFKIPIILLINKIDLCSQQELEESISHWKSIFPNMDIYPVSAIEGFFIDELIEIFKDNYLFGSGIRSFREICGSYEIELSLTKACTTHPHHYLLEILSETGIIGLLIFLFIIYLIVQKNNSKNKNILSISLLIIILCYLFPFRPTGSIFSSWHGGFFYILVGFNFYLLNYNNEKKYI